jgi:hypothetical protein
MSLSPNPAWYGLTGCAKGLARAAGHRQPEPEHYLLAMVYAEPAVAPALGHVGASQRALLEALARRGVQVPAVDPPVHRPWRGHRGVEVTETEPTLDILAERHPPGSEWRWGSTGWRARSRAGRGGPGSTARKGSTWTGRWPRPGNGPAPSPARRRARGAAQAPMVTTSSVRSMASSRADRAGVAARSSSRRRRARRASTRVRASQGTPNGASSRWKATPRQPP